MFLKSPSSITVSPPPNYDTRVKFNPASESTDYIDDRDLLRIFITGIHASTSHFSILYQIPRNTCALLMYQHVFSKFVVPNNALVPTEDKTYTGLTAFTHTLLVPKLTSELPNQSLKAKYFIGSTDKFVDLKLNVNQLIIPGPLHTGLLLDGCHIMAMMKIRYILLKDVETLKRNDVSLFDMYHAPSGSEIALSAIAKILLKVLFDNEFGDIDTQNEYKIKDFTSSPNKERKQAIINFLHPDTVFEYDATRSSFTDCVLTNGELISNYNFRDSGINKIWGFRWINMLAMKNDDLKSVLNKLSKKKTEIIEDYTLAFFEALNGSTKGLSTNSLIIGNGSDTIGLLDKPFAGVNLFSYDYGVHDKCGETNVRTHAANGLIVRFTPEEEYRGKLKKIHFDVFALDVAADADAVIEEDENDRDNFFVIISIPGATSKENAQNYILKNVNIGIEPTEDIASNPKYDRWVDRFDLNYEFGYYVKETNDLVITDNSITALNINFVNKGVGVDFRGKAFPEYVYKEEAAEIVLTVTTFAEERLRHLSLDLNAGQLFRNDGFEIKSAKKKSDFWSKTNSVEREKIKELIRILKETYTTVTTSLSGGGIGMIGIPPTYDSSKVYVTGEYVLFDNKPYISIADANTNKNPSTETGYWKKNMIQSGSHYYDYDTAVIPDFIYESTSQKIYRLKKKYTSTSETIPPENWEEVAKVHSETSGYAIGAKVIYDNKLYVARTTVPAGGETFKESSWKRLPNVIQDPRYLPFSGLGGPPADTPLLGEPLDTPASQLKLNTYEYLKYSFAEFEFGINNVNIKIQSYASPLASRLGFRYSGDTASPDFDAGSSSNMARKTFVDEHTIAGKNPSVSTAFKHTSVSPTLFSYNQVLSALRCFGILETIVCRINTISNNDTTVSTKLNALLSSATTVETAPLYNTAGTAIVPNNNGVIKYTDTTPTNYGYLQLKWYTTNTEEATEYTGCAD
jgi:hypothetical protein